MLSPEFFLSDWLQSLGLTDGPLEVLNTTTAIQFGLVYNYLPLFVLPLYATLERMDWKLVDAATDLGASQWAAFRQITLRLTAPGLITGTLLVFIPMMGEYVIPLVLGGGRVDFIGNVIQRLFLEAQDYALGLRARGARDGLAVVLRRALPLPLDAHGAGVRCLSRCARSGAFLGALCFVAGIIAVVALAGRPRGRRGVGARADRGRARRGRDRARPAARAAAEAARAASARWSTRSSSSRSSWS